MRNPLLRNLFRRSSEEEPARALFRQIAAQARQPAFFRGCGVPDSVDGRFDLLVLHVFLVMHRLKRERARTAGLSQALFDVLFENMDESLRQLGAGDMGVGRRIKAMAEGFYGRILAYERALEDDSGGHGGHGGKEGRGGLLEDCLCRNLYGGAEPAPGQLAALSAYVRREADALAAQETGRLMAGELAFGPAPEPMPEPASDPEVGGGTGH